MASQRFVMMVDPAEREEWRAKASRAGITTAEFIRRAVAWYDPEDADALTELEVLMPEFQAALSGIHQSLDHSIAALKWATDPQRDVESRAKVEAELAAMPQIEKDRLAAVFG